MLKFMIIAIHNRGREIREWPTWGHNSY